MDFVLVTSVGASLFVFLTFSKPLNPEHPGLQLFLVIWEILVVYGDLGHNYKPGCSITSRVQQFQQVSFSGHLYFPFVFFHLTFSENTSPPFPMDLLPWLVGWRAVWALLSTSYYVPDETWQSVEVNTLYSLCIVLLVHIFCLLGGA